jgi:hypothetical protein
MNIKETKAVFDKIISDIHSDGEKGYESFTHQWSKLTYEQRQLLNFFLTRYVNYIFEREEFVAEEHQFYWIAILQEANSEFIGDNVGIKLALSDQVSDKQIAKLFYDLKTFGHIQDTLETIAKAIANLFNLNFNTVYKYLRNPGEFEKTRSLVQFVKKDTQNDS